MAKVNKPIFPKTDKRLLGVWKSDKRRTFAEWAWKKNTPLGKRARQKSHFGKLEITYTRNKIHCSFPHSEYEVARRYVILGMDDESVAIAIFGEREIKDRRKYNPDNLECLRQLFPPKTAIRQIHFDRNHYWIPIGNGNHREFFRKIRGGE